MSSKVSVIVPAYNAEKFIAETVESVLNQTYKNYEIIVVDDGSTDGTVEVLKEFKPKINLILKRNGGPASARNLAIKNSTGEYIAFLDCDDLWNEDKLEKQVSYLDRHPGTGLLFSEAWMFTEENGRKVFREKIGYTGDPSFRMLLFGDFIPNSSVIIRRKCVDTVGYQNESPDLIAVEDYEYWMRISRSFEMAGIAQPLALYRIREDNLMGEDINKGLTLSLRAIKAIEDQFPKMWEETGVDRSLLFAKLYIRAGYAWKRKRDIRQCLNNYFQALKISSRPKVFRWIIAATILKHWS